MASKGSRLVSKYAYNVRVWSYPVEVTVDGAVTAHKSYEVRHGEHTVGRFLHIDLGEHALDSANAFAAGYATALAQSRTNPAAYRWLGQGTEMWLMGPHDHHAATVYAEGSWHTWDLNGIGGENSRERSLKAAYREAMAAVLRWAAAQVDWP